MELLDIELFRKNLLVTQRYCHLQLKKQTKSIAHALRTIDRYNGIELFSYELQPGNAYFDPYVSANWVTDPLSEKDNSWYNKLFEFQLEYKSNFLSQGSFEDRNFNGRILIIGIDMTLLDGVSEAMSGGLIDVYDFPPIDTWFYTTGVQHKRLLYAWIPEQFLELAGKAIGVNCVDNIHWYEAPRF